MKLDQAEKENYLKLKREFKQKFKENDGYNYLEGVRNLVEDYQLISYQLRMSGEICNRQYVQFFNMVQKVKNTLESIEEGWQNHLQEIEDDNEQIY